MVQAADLLPQHHAGHDGGAGAPQPAAQWDGVLDVHVSLGGEGSLVVATQNVQGHAGDEVPGGVEGDVVRVLALALVGDAAVEREGRGRGGAVDGHGQL